MKKLCILTLSLVLLAADAPDQPNVDHYKEGQRFFVEKNYASALEEFTEVDELVPDNPQVYSWIGACLNELGRHAEAKDRLERAFELLREEHRRGIELGRPEPPIDIGYYTLLAAIRLNLREFSQAVETLNSYTFEDDGSEYATKTRQAFDAAKQTLKAKLAAIGTECLSRRDLDCVRATFTQADTVYPAGPSVRESIARDLLTRGESAPAVTDEDKTKKAELHETAVVAGRLWVEEGGARATDAQRLLAKALSGTKRKEGYEESIRILKSLWESAADPAKRDSSIQLDLSVAQAGLEQWEQVVNSSSAFIEQNPRDPLGQGYCLRSFGQFQLGHCQETINDGEQCKTAEGNTRPLKHVDLCRQRLAKKEADRAAAKEAQEAVAERQCDYLYDRARWARNSLDGIPFEDLVKVIGDFKPREAQCRPTLEAAERAAGREFSSPTPVLCAAGAKTASLPLNLSTRSKDDLESTVTQAKKLLSLCKSSLDATQIAAAEGGLSKVEQEIVRRH